MILTNNQKAKVFELTRISIEILNNQNCDNKIFFSAPTGSGKTFMLSNVIWDLINKFEKIVIFFVSLSTGQIEKQNFDNYIKYRKNSTKIVSPHFCSYLKSDKNTNSSSVKEIKNANNFSRESKQLYFLGTQLFTKKTLLYKNEILEKELKFFKENEYKIVYIRDEAHISKSSIYDKTGSENLNNLFQNYSNLSIFCSATINSLLSNYNTVVFSEEEAVQDCLIKNNLKNFYGIKNNSIMTSEELTELCINNFIEQQKKYKLLELDINPALLIQIPSKSNIHNETRERFLIKFLISQVNSKNLNFVIWCDEFYSDIEYTNISELKNKNSEFIRDYISKNDSIVDIIIFKVALAIGWDIPRANTLLQLRELHSDDLNIQTIGRIRRNPLYPLDKIKEKAFNFCDDYFIYTNNISSNIKLKQISLRQEFYNLKIKHPKSIQTTTKFNNDFLNKKMNELLPLVITEDFLLNDTSNLHILQKNKNVEIYLLTNQYFWFTKFFEHYSFALDHVTFNVFYEIIKKWIKNNKLHKLTHKILRRIIERSEDFIELINDCIDIEYFDELEEHTLPRTTQVELVVLKGNNSDFSNSRKTLSLNSFKNFAEKKWGYNEVINTINKMEIANFENIDDIQLDSNGEYECCNSILKWISASDQNYKQTKLFTKHYISSSLIKYPYIFGQPNVMSKIHNTYPDFFLILNNKNNTINVIIEVKSRNQDYNYGKTMAIREMFEKLSRNPEFHNYYFAIYLYNNDVQSRHDIQVWNKGKKMEFHDISVFLNWIVGRK